MADQVKQVRLIIADLDPERQCFTDDDLRGFLEIESGVKRAAAAALDAIASSEALVSKVISTQDRSSNGAAVADALRAHAAALRAQADQEDESTDSFFYITGMTPPRMEGEEYRCH